MAAADIAKEADETELPDDLEQQVRQHLEQEPELSWDQALDLCITADLAPGTDDEDN
jgi:hypothetical protein